MTNLTWQQVALTAVMLFAAFFAHIYLGMAPGMAAGFVTTVVAFYLGRAKTEERPSFLEGIRQYVNGEKTQEKETAEKEKS